MLNYKAIELHTHTKHSDGNFTVEELLERSCENMLDGVAITDHNTVSALQEVTPALQEKYLPVIKGIEWTTFFGHLVVLNARDFVDWRLPQKDNIDEYLKKIQAVGGTAGIAHPCVLGDPICTGCHWDFIVKDWTLIDYIEVWSEPFPVLNYWNPLALDMWTKLLCKGYKIAATSGRDWHRVNPDKVEHAAVTYVGIADDCITSDSVANAIKQGRTFVTSGPFMHIDFFQNGKNFELGDEVSAGVLDISVSVSEDVRRKRWEEFGIKTKMVKVIHNAEVVASLDVDEANFSINVQKGFVRIEMYGDYLGEPNTLLGFSSPVYVV